MIEALQAGRYLQVAQVLVVVFRGWQMIRTPLLHLSFLVSHQALRKDKS